MLVSAEEVAARAREPRRSPATWSRTIREEVDSEDTQRQRLARAYKESQAEDARLSALANRDYWRVPLPAIADAPMLARCTYPPSLPDSTPGSSSRARYLAQALHNLRKSCRHAVASVLSKHGLCHRARKLAIKARRSRPPHSAVAFDARKKAGAGSCCLLSHRCHLCLRRPSPLASSPPPTSKLDAILAHLQQYGCDWQLWTQYYDVGACNLVHIHSSWRHPVLGSVRSGTYAFAVAGAGSAMPEKSSGIISNGAIGDLSTHCWLPYCNLGPPGRFVWPRRQLERRRYFRILYPL